MCSDDISTFAAARSLRLLWARCTWRLLPAVPAKRRSTPARSVIMNDPELLSRIAMSLDAYGWEVAP